MKSPAGKTKASNDFAQKYQAGLHDFIQQGVTNKLETALALGHKAVAIGLETMDLALIHEEIWPAEITQNDTSARAQAVAQARHFFAEALLPIEATHRALFETNSTLKKRNQELKEEIAYRKKIELELRQSEKFARAIVEKSERQQQRLQVLSRRLLSVQEDERKRISRDLHDVIAQVLTGINVRLSTLKNDAQINAKVFSKNLTRAQKLVAKSVEIVHQFAYDLRPAMLDDLGLVATLKMYLKKFTEETGIQATLSSSLEKDKLNGISRTVLYRVVQESLSNVSRHAEASLVEVKIEQIENKVSLVVKNNGKSFDVESALDAVKSKRLGLLSMRERVEMVHGHFSIESSPDKGTSVKVDIPLQENKQLRSPR